MKKLFLLGFLALSCLFVNAQEGLQGTWFAGGAVGFGSSKDGQGDEQTKNTSFAIQPLVGTFISPNVAVGAAIGFASDKEKLGGEQVSKTTGFVIQPFARKYWNLTGNLYFFGEAALPVEFGSGEGANSDSKITYTDFNLVLSPGFDWIVNSWFTVETKFEVFRVGYNSTKPKGGKTNSDFGLYGNSHQNTLGDLTVGVKFLF